MSELHIEDRIVRAGERTFVIAEIGVNHDGSVDRALELVHHAAAAGADAIKLQVFCAARLMHPTSGFAEYQLDRVDDADPIKMLERYELSEQAMLTIVSAARRANLIPLATPFSPGDVDTIARLNLPAVKIASPDLVNRPLLERVAELDRPMLVSTGAATMGETAQSVEWLRAWGPAFALLHCVSSYPVPAASANLSWIDELADRFNVPVGYSDHTNEPMCGALAVMAGACVVEKHLTYDKRASGPDHLASCDPADFAAYVSALRSAELLRGKPGKHVLPMEQDVRTVSRQSLVVSSAVAAGHVITEQDLTVQRPGTGIPASEIAAVLGRVIGRSIPSGTMLRWDMLLGEPTHAVAA